MKDFLFGAAYGLTLFILIIGLLYVGCKITQLVFKDDGPCIITLDPRPLPYMDMMDRIAP